MVAGVALDRKRLLSGRRGARIHTVDQRAKDGGGRLPGDRWEWTVKACFAGDRDGKQEGGQYIPHPHE